MRQYEFTLKFALERCDSDPEAFVERLLGEGCDDAIAGVGQRGRIALAFTRKADSAEEAMLTALADVRNVIPNARFVEATPDLVGLSDLGRLLGCSRQYMRKLLETAGAEFPLPVHDGKRPIWHLVSVLTWLAKERRRRIDTTLLDIAQVNMHCNLIREQSRLDQVAMDTDGHISNRLKRAIAA